MNININTIDLGIDTMSSFLGLSKEEFVRIITGIGLINDGDVSTHILSNEYIKNHLQNNDRKKITHVRIFHLSRQLKNVKKYSPMNLRDVLLKKTSLSNFFKEHNITFKCDNNRCIHMYRNGKIISQDNYLKSRLWYQGDYCDCNINGFLVPAYDNYKGYLNTLSNAPEIVLRISELLKDESIVTNYYNHSIMYRYEFLVPLHCFKPMQMWDSDFSDVELEEYIIRVLAQYIYNLYINELDHSDNVMVIVNLDTENEIEVISREVITK